MLVTLGTNTALGAGASITLPYACTSVQKIFIKIDDASGTTAYDHSIQVQLGSRVIVNSSGAGLFYFSGLLGGSDEAGINPCPYQIDLGNHELMHNENLYVRVTGGSAALDAVDVSALVDQPNTMVARKYTEYTDTTFTQSDCLSAICYDATYNTSIAEATGVCEIRDSVSSSAPAFISSVNWAQAINSNQGTNTEVGLLKLSSTPLTTSFNYSSDKVDRILAVSQMPVSRAQTNQAKFTNRQRANAVGR